jgi:2-polyprenyl-6-hydroxyphenyl methylase/3-demethylubiquinone-9 3-methyltransferase
MLNQLMRYVPLIHLIKRERCDRILEVGGGFSGVNRYLPEKVVIGVDISFNDSGNAGNGRFFPVKGMAQRLPFTDNSFPVVVCSDVLEHICTDEREAVIRELWRVSSGRIYLSFPVNETYGKWEQRLLALYKLFKIEIPDWMADHIRKGLPSEKSAAGFLKENKMSFKVIPNENNLIHFAVMLLESSILSKLITSVVGVIAPEKWVFSEHSFMANLTRGVFLPFKQLPRFLNFGGTVRKIFIITKNGPAAKPDGRSVADYYNANPGMMSSPFGGIKSLPGAEHEYLTETLARFKVDLRDKKVLDAGCGSGWFARYGKGVVRAYTGVDISSASVELCKKIMPDIIQADSQDLPFNAGSFDYVFCIDSFEHIPDQYLAAREFYRVLSKDGRVFLSVPNYSNVAGIVKKFEEAAGFYEKDSWAPFDHWSCQALEQFMTPKRVKKIFKEAGFNTFSVIGGRFDLLDGIFPWINHKRMPYPFNVRDLFLRVQKPLERFHWLSLHNFWLIEKR